MMSSQVKPQRVLSTRRAQDLRLQLVKTEASIRCGQRIRTAREAKHLSQSALARLLPGRVDGPSVSRWERGEVMPGPANIEGLAAALGQDYAYFVVPDAPETPDLMSALSNANSDPSQLDRIEEMLIELLTRITPAETPEDVADEAAAQHEAKPPAAAPSAAPRRRKGRAA